MTTALSITSKEFWSYTSKSLMSSLLNCWQAWLYNDRISPWHCSAEHDYFEQVSVHCHVVSVKPQGQSGFSPVLFFCHLHVTCGKMNSLGCKNIVLEIQPKSQLLEWIQAGSILFFSKNWLSRETILTVVKRLSMLCHFLHHSYCHEILNENLLRYL